MYRSVPSTRQCPHTGSADKNQKCTNGRISIRQRCTMYKKMYADCHRQVIVIVIGHPRARCPPYQADADRQNKRSTPPGRPVPPTTGQQQVKIITGPPADYRQPTSTTYRQSSSIGQHLTDVNNRLSTRPTDQQPTASHVTSECQRSTITVNHHHWPAYRLPEQVIRSKDQSVDSDESVYKSKIDDRQHRLEHLDT